MAEGIGGLHGLGSRVLGQGGLTVDGLGLRVRGDFVV